MAEVFRPAYTTTDPATGKRARRRSPTWWVRYYLPSGERKKVKGFKDRKATQTLAAELERRAARLAAGLVDPLEEHAKKPLAEHAEDYRRYLAAKGNTGGHVKKTLARLLACLDGCRFVRIVDVQPSGVVEFLAQLRAEGKSITTANYYLVAAKGFTRWLWRDKRTAADSLAGMSKLAHADTEVRHARRDFSPEEMSWLLKVVQAGNREHHGLTALDRFALYLTAAGTGFRVAELATLKPASFNLEGDMPTVRCQAAYSKNRKQVDQPLPPDVAQFLREYLAGKPEDAPLWPGCWKDGAAEMIRLDLANARQEWLAGFQDAQERTRAGQSDFLTYCNAEGLYADFHALRHTYISRIVSSGASPKTAQTLARHSTVTLTLGRYAHVGLYDLAAAVNNLPAVLPADRKPAAMGATGTDGRAPAPKKPPRRAD